MCAYYLAYDFVICAATEIPIDDVAKQVKFISKTGLITRRTIISDQFDVSYSDDSSLL
jgi:hypothetical protein